MSYTAKCEVCKHYTTVNPVTVYVRGIAMLTYICDKCQAKKDYEEAQKGGDSE